MLSLPRTSLHPEQEQEYKELEGEEKLGTASELVVVPKNAFHTYIQVFYPHLQLLIVT